MYLHVPFCVRKCPYCDFYSVADPSLIPSFVDALLGEIHCHGHEAWRFDSLYFGGGTPSLLPPGVVGRLLAAAGQAFDILPRTEITLEVNPGTVDAGRLRAYRDLAVNRLNIGVQSFQDRHLEFLGRIHTVADARRTIRAARTAGFDNIGLDLMYGLPGQEADDWRADLEAALAFAPEHLSCYLLTYETGTPLDRARRKGDIRPLTEGRAADLFRQTIEVLGARGYRQYEISNFAAAQQLESRHNWKYWTRAPYLGLGPSAHSFKDEVRRWNVRSVRTYIERLAREQDPTEASERLTKSQRLTEAIYLGLRTTEGLWLDVFARQFGCDFQVVFDETIRSLKQAGLARLTRERFFLTPEGMLLLDSIAVAFDAPGEAEIDSTL